MYGGCICLSNSSRSHIDVCGGCARYLAPTLPATVMASIHRPTAYGKVVAVPALYNTTRHHTTH